MCKIPLDNSIKSNLPVFGPLFHLSTNWLNEKIN